MKNYTLILNTYIQYVNKLEALLFTATSLDHRYLMLLNCEEAYIEQSRRWKQTILVGALPTNKGSNSVD